MPRTTQETPVTEPVATPGSLERERASEEIATRDPLDRLEVVSDRTTDTPAEVTEAVREHGPAPHELRRRALAPLLDEFAELDGPDTGTSGGYSLALGGYDIELGAWERSVRRRSVADTSAEAEDSFLLLAECIAFQACFHSLVEIFDRGPMPPPAELPRFLDRLVTDVAVGLALQEELNQEVGRLIHGGDLAGARDLTALRHKIVQFGTDLKERVGAVAFEQAEQRAETFVTHMKDVEVQPRIRPSENDVPKALPRRQAGPAEGVPGPTEEVPEPDWDETCVDALKNQPRIAPKLKGPPRSILRPTLFVLVVLCVIWAAFILPGLRRTGPPVLTFDQFAHIDAVVSISARPPSLFVRIDGGTWEGLSQPARREIMLQIGKVAGSAGYHGVNARTTDGAMAGQWLRKSGVHVRASTTDAT